MKTRTNKRSIKNRRNTKKFRGGMDSAPAPAPRLAKRRDAFFSPDKKYFSEIVQGEPAPADEQLPPPGVECTEANAEIMKQAQAERKKGGYINTETIKKMNLEIIPPKMGGRPAHKCEFHPLWKWRMPKTWRGTEFEPVTKNCEKCEICINGGANPPELSGDGKSSAEVIGDSGTTSSSSEESNCGENAKKALKLFNSLQNGEIDANTVEACIKSPHADIVSVATPVTVPDPQVVTASVVDRDATALGGPDSTESVSVVVGGKRKKSKSKRTRRRGRKTKRTRRRSRKTKRNKRKLKKRNSRKQ